MLAVRVGGSNRCMAGLDDLDWMRKIAPYYDVDIERLGCSNLQT